MEPKPIFINYRRDDGLDTAQLLQLRLEHIFGEGTTFLDTDSIFPGDEYPVRLENAVKAAKVIIVMIGTHWTGSDPRNNKLHNPEDWVRKELEISLSDPKKIILPVFIKGASAEQAFAGIPAHLDKLTKLNDVQLRERQFKSDLLAILPHIERHLSLRDPLGELPYDTSRYFFPRQGPFKGLAYFTEEDTRIFFGRGEKRSGSSFSKSPMTLSCFYMVNPAPENHLCCLPG